MIEYAHIKFAKGVADPKSHNLSAVHETFKSHSSVHKRQEYRIVRDGDTVTLTALANGESVDIAWSNVLFGKRAKVAKPEAKAKG